jgi:hypothetical protein
VIPREAACAQAKVSAQFASIKGDAGRPHNLLSMGEEAWNKWEANEPQSWIAIEFQNTMSFRGIDIKSAGDHPKRAPTMVRVTTLDEETQKWNEIGFAQMNFGENLWHTLKFPNMQGEGRVVRFNFTNTKDKAL